MILKRRVLTIVLVIALLLFSSATYAGDDLYYGGFDGSWEGKLHFITPNLREFAYVLGSEGSDPKRGMEIKITVNNENIRVYHRYEERWREVKPGKFIINEHKTNAVIFVNDSSSDIQDKTGKGGWVETWNITLTHKDKDTLYAYWVRAINNYLEPYDKKDNKGNYMGRFIRSSFGELRKIK